MRVLVAGAGRGIGRATAEFTQAMRDLLGITW